ncbi:MAG: restriction endonuclease [Rhodospirillales bacterium]|nr:restriction endonuclease [Rhodospirillales bacterium]
MLDRIKSLEPTVFENLVYDLMGSSGFENLVWRTPGADGGRDIEGTALCRDLSGFMHAQTWYIECKRYEGTLSWPLIWQKIAFSEASDTDYLLVVTTSTPSPQAETKISEWNNSRKRPQVRVWRGYELERKIQLVPVLQVKYGLVDDPDLRPDAFWPLAEKSMKAILAAKGSLVVPKLTPLYVEYATALSQLLSRRLEDLSTEGKIVVSGFNKDKDKYDWLDVSGLRNSDTFDSFGVRAIISGLRIWAKEGSSIKVDQILNNKISISVEFKRYPPDSLLNEIKDVCLWSDLEFYLEDLFLIITARG